MPTDLIIFMRWLGLLEAAAPAPKSPRKKGEWFKDGDVPF